MVFQSFAVTGIIAIVFMGSGRAIAKNYTYKAMPEAGGDAARITVRNAGDSPRRKSCELWVDSAVFSPYWGRIIRNIINGFPSGEIVVYAPWSNAKARIRPHAQTSIYAGFQTELFRNSEHVTGNIILLHPTVFPMEQNVGTVHLNKVTVCLPEIDVSEYNYPWRLWARKHNARLLFSPNFGEKTEPAENGVFWWSLIFNE